MDERGFGEDERAAAAAVAKHQALQAATPSRYQFVWQGVTFDFYRLCEITGVTKAPAQHAMKKIIRAGKSIKPVEQEIDEAINALRRWKEMIIEERRAA